jgi:serine/threonine protein kinase/Tol biopolymer transport system component
MLTAGENFSHYKLISAIGAGGMGEVYLAEDTLLGRKVALKVLPAEVVKNQDRMRRFDQEAKAAAALNHPNIAHVYEIGEFEGMNFIAMEFVEGVSLEEKIAGAPLPVAEIVRIGSQIADALDEAHSHGIVHRDIKSANVMLDRRGRAKVLDFGLAKLSPFVDSEDKTAVKTRSGIVMGTASYMSPEQALGRETDARTDIWSLGVVLYEMTTGRLPFHGESITETIDKITHTQPEAIARFNYDVPPELEVIIKKSLRKVPDERFQSAHDLLIDLKALSREMDLAEHSLAPSFQREGDGETPFRPETGEQATKTLIHSRTTEESATAIHTTSSAEYIVGEIKRHKIGMLAVAAILLVGLIAGGFGVYRLLSSRKDPAAPRELKFLRLTMGGKIGSENITGGADISPDGKRVVFWTELDGKASCWVRQVSSNSTVRIFGPAEGDYGGSTFSRDGEFVYFNLSDKSNPQPALFQIPILGGSPRRIIEGVSSPVTFSPDGKQIAFVRYTPNEGESALMVANADGSGTARTLATHKQPEYFSNEGPSWSPDGKVIACGAGSNTANLVNGTVVEVPADGGVGRAITSARWNYVARVVWLADGTGLVVDSFANAISSGTQLWFVSYPDGNARRITNDLNGYGTVSLGLTSDANTIVTVQEDFSAPIFTIGQNEDPSRAKQISNGKYEGIICLANTPDDKVVYCDHSGDANDIWIMNGDGSEKKPLTNDQFLKAVATVSPDGRFIVFATNRSGNINIWRIDIDGNNLKQLTEGSAEDDDPVYSLDGKWVIFDSLRSGKKTLWKVSIDGGTPVQLTDKVSWHPSISPDGKLIACFLVDEKAVSRTRLGLLSLDGGDFVKSFDLSDSVNIDAGVKWTPDGQGLTYINEPYISNIVSQPIAGGPVKPLTSFKSDRIFNFAWSHNGKQIVYSRGPFIDDVVLIKDFR